VFIVNSEYQADWCAVQWPDCWRNDLRAQSLCWSQVRSRFEIPMRQRFAIERDGPTWRPRGKCADGRYIRPSGLTTHCYPLGPASRWTPTGTRKSAHPMFPVTVWTDTACPVTLGACTAADATPDVAVTVANRTFVRNKPAPSTFVLFVRHGELRPSAGSMGGASPTLLPN